LAWTGAHSAARPGVYIFNDPDFDLCDHPRHCRDRGLQVPVQRAAVSPEQEEQRRELRALVVKPAEEANVPALAAAIQTFGIPCGQLVAVEFHEHLAAKPESALPLEQKAALPVGSKESASRVPACCELPWATHDKPVVRCDPSELVAQSVEPDSAAVFAVLLSCAAVSFAESRVRRASRERPVCSCLLDKLYPAAVRWARL